MASEACMQFFILFLMCELIHPETGEGGSWQHWTVVKYRDSGFMDCNNEWMSAIALIQQILQ